MGLSEEGIKEFKQAYLKGHNEEISDAQAKEMEFSTAKRLTSGDKGVI
ncbi:MAG: hypothetical protein PHE77_03960 [Candidatus Pacebacteria bacterium]|nr:hypothetical protein [Candidatus Paceibacterota bacterium]